MSLPTWAVTAATWTWVIIGALGVVLAVSMACQWIAAEMMRHLRIWCDFVGFVAMRANGSMNPGESYERELARLHQESSDARSLLAMVDVRADAALRDIDTWGRLVPTDIRAMDTRPWDERPESSRYDEVVWDRLPEWLRSLPHPSNAREAEEVVISLRHLVLTLKGSTVEAGPPKGPAS